LFESLREFCLREALTGVGLFLARALIVEGKREVRRKIIERVEMVLRCTWIDFM